MLISTRQKLQNCPPPLTVSIDSSNVEQVSQHRVLGVLLDDRFQWEAHTDGICKKLSQNLFLLSKLKHFVDVDTRKLFFNAHIRPRIDYVSTVWDNCSQVHFLKVNSLWFAVKSPQCQVGLGQVARDDLTEFWGRLDSVLRPT